MLNIVTCYAWNKGAFTLTRVQVTAYGYPSASYSKHEFARIPMQVHYEFDFHSYGSFCAGLVSRQPVRVGM